jgi:PAS domain-containing protein
MRVFFQKSLAWGKAAPSMGEQVFSRREIRGIDVSEFKQTGSEPGDCSPNFAQRPEPFESESDFFSTMLGLLSSVVFVTDPRGLIVWVSKALQGVSGYSAAELRGSFIWDLAKPADREAARRYFERVVVGGLTELGTQERLTEQKAPQPQASLETAVALAEDLSQPLEAIAAYARAGLLQLRKRPVDSDKITNSLEKIIIQVQSAAEILRNVRESR